MTEQESQLVARINELSAIARTSWLALLAYLAYIGITLLAVEDADFFVPSRQTELPLVGIAIPTFSFFIFAPPLAAALYIYLHIHLLKLWDALATAPPRIAGEALGDRIHPWLANDLFLTLRGDGAASARPLRRLSNLASRLLVWVFGPFVLFGFWWRSMPAHDEWLTLFLGLCLLVASYAGLSSWWSTTAAARRLFRRPWPKPWRGFWRRLLGLFVAAAVLAASWVSTEGGFDHYADRAVVLYEAATGRQVFETGTYPNGDVKPAALVREEWIADQWWIPDLETFAVVIDSETWLVGPWLGPETSFEWNPLARINLMGDELVPLPADWRTPETARHAFRQTWCAREGLAMDICDHPGTADRPPPAHVGPERRAWCDRAGGAETDAARYAGATCDAFFADLDRRFETAWTEERRSALASRDSPDLAGVDLRRALMSGASLVGADLGGARLEGAVLRRAQMEGANLVAARLEGANLVATRLAGANLSEARLKRTNLAEARLEGADLSEARLEGAVLRWARLEGADLRWARLEGADLRWARLEGGNLYGARLEGADLSEARLEGAVLRWARLEGADLRWARLEGADLFKARLEGADLAGARLEGADLREARLEGADLGGARPEGADLRGARLEGADLRGAGFRSAIWADASNRASPAQFADLRGGRSLMQAQLEDLIGNVETLLPEGPSDTGAPYHVWSCWETPPPDLDGIVATAAGRFASDEDRGRLRAEFLCGPDNPRRETGTPCALELTRAQCLDPAQNPHHPANRPR